MDPIYTFQLPSSLADAWRIGYPLLIGLGALSAWATMRLTLPSDPKIRFFLPSLPEGLLLTIDLIVSILVAVGGSLLVFHPTTPMAAFTAGFTWAAAQELIGRPKHSHSNFVHDRARIARELAEEAAS